MSVSTMIRDNGISVTVSTRSATSVDAVGSRTDTYGTNTVVTGFVQISSATQQVEAGAQRVAATAVIYFEPSVTITQNDRVIFDSRTFDVVSVRTPDQKTSDHHLAYQIVDAVEVFG